MHDTNKTMCDTKKTMRSANKTIRGAERVINYELGVMNCLAFVVYDLLFYCLYSFESKRLLISFMKKHFIIIFLITSSFLIACMGCNNKPNCNLDTKVLKKNDSLIAVLKSRKSLYFYLNKLKEPELEFFKEEKETYRFFVLSSFGDYHSYRINKSGNKYVILSKSYFEYKEDTLQHENIRIDSLSKERKTILSKQNWASIKKSLDAMNFWSLPVQDKDEHSYLDGVIYLAEGYTSEKNECTGRNYHAVMRISPADSTRYKSVFKQIEELASK
jgi:hypothetical protein